MEKEITRLKKMQGQIDELHKVLSKHEADNNKREIVKIEKKLIELVDKSISIITKSKESITKRQRQPKA
jgi:uncharacterized membrane protein (DUF106 family)